jgi:hypothetical protein
MAAPISSGSTIVTARQVALRRAGTEPNLAEMAGVTLIAISLSAPTRGAPTSRRLAETGYVRLDPDQSHALVEGQSIRQVQSRAITTGKASLRQPPQTT